MLKRMSETTPEQARERYQKVIDELNIEYVRDAVQRPITYSIETLYHFECHACDKWWSIGDYPMIEIDQIICPHCGNTATPEPDHV